jgi:glycine/serine hydroxymethyltransferase
MLDAEFAYVQPHSGAQANAAAALVSPGERPLGLDLAMAVTLTHGMKLNFSDKLYGSGCYGVDPVTGRIDNHAAAFRGHRRRKSVRTSGRPRHAGGPAKAVTFNIAGLRSSSSASAARFLVLSSSPTG